MTSIAPLLSGERRGPLAAIARGGLSIVSIVYRLAVYVRNRRFDKMRGVHKVDVPVVCIGNITTGGTGKTPVVCLVAQILRQQNLRVAIVSRGYGRGDAGVNDEAMELYDRLPDVPHVQDPDRVSAANVAIDELDCEIILMDDGFGHRRLFRDANIVLIDMTNPFGYGKLLPRGLLREPIASLGRSELVILTRCDLVSPDVIKNVRETIRRHTDVPILTSRHRPSQLRNNRGKTESLQMIERQSVGLVSAIGNPSAFEQTVRKLNVAVEDHRQLTDHAAMDRDVMSSLHRWAQTLDAKMIVCTHKDLVKLQIDQLGGKSLWALQIDLELDDPNEHLLKLLQAIGPAKLPIV